MRDEMPVTGLGKFEILTE